MGFFSKLKRLWTTEDAPKQAEQEAPEGAEEAAAEEIESAEPIAAEPESQELPAEEVQPEAPEQAAEEVVVESEEPVQEAAVEAPESVQPEVVLEPEFITEVEPAVEVEPAEAAEEPEVTEEPEPVEEPEVVVEPAPEVAPEPVVVPEPEQTPVAAPVEQAKPEAATLVTEDQPQWQKDLTIALRGAEPKLSVWLEHVLDGIEEVGDPLWERLRFFFDALDAPKDETESFISNFADWLDDMEYDYVSDFRSELQFRLALALDLEDEEDERSRLFLKLSEGLSKTKEQITKQIDGLLATHSEIDESFWEEFEEILIMSDVGFEPTMKLVERLRERVRKAGTKDPAKFKEFMREELEEIFKTGPRITVVNKPEVVLMVGVNGVGKTTTIAKLAYRAQLQGKKVLIAAGDTFRAAAIEQLQVWADRIGVDFHAKSANSDPAAVAYEAVEKAVEGGYDLLFVDTAGRLQTKVGLMDELQKIRNVLGKKHEGAPHRTILTIDATTGQNALSQTKLFNEVASLDEIILTKLDGTAKGGIVVAIAMEFNIPITYIGLGEKMEDLRPFNGADFATALLGLEDAPEA
ncbi:signal recognition particle-docking protein FtsY [Halodesulfovibrio marinisediminis]|uniref:Signal recognition particle receptor FtsY n=1 Tax=Halodesulfovibrio marinisediminis DSM 17456 TaxID=1121457 RepID=A0A1N6J188_9BACT|nr:signal recognition particle-docking protein FtsY [Halodesulfovibrio marinisediminis]SIO38023.1 signal recognition particle-docking protein FtsY [Halodesulfovibrio marinisediminis DSM 17456]